MVFNSNIYFAALVENYNDGNIGNGIILEPKGYGDAFIAKSDLNGNFIWASMGDHENSWGDSYGTDLIIDENENIYMGGSFRFNIIFGGDTLIGNSGQGDGFIVKCSSVGSFYWVRQVDECAAGVSVDAANNPFVVYDKYIAKFNGNGTGQWTNELNNYPSCITNNSSNKILIAGSIDENIFLSQLHNNANAEWLVQFNGDSGFGHVIGTVSDNSGNLYTYAYASAQMDYFGETIQRGSFISKQKGTGELIWIKQFVDIYQNRGYGSYMAIDPSRENIFITGELTDVLAIPEGPTLMPGEEGGYFIIKYGIDGTFIFAVKEDFNSDYWGGLCLATDFAGSTIISGTFQETINIGGTELISAGSDDVFISKYNPNGDFLWAMRAGGDNVEYSGLVSVDANDNIYFTGEFCSENVTIGNTQITMEEGDGNIIFAKLSPDGTVQWATSKAGSTIPYYGDYYSWPTGIKTDAQGFTYIKGWYGDSTYFDDIMLCSPYSSMSKFIAKIDPEGNVIWVNPIKEHHYGMDYNQMDIDIAGNVYIGSQIADTVHFGNDFTYINVGECDLFVAKYTTAGELDWVKFMESTTGSNWYNYLSSVSVFDSTNVFIGGYFTNYISFGNNEKYSNSKHGFIAMIGEDISGFEEVYNRMDNGISICPNPFTHKTTIKFHNPNHSKYKLSVFNITGHKVFEMDNITTGKVELERGNLSNGVYLIELRGKNVFRGKIIIE